MAFEVRRGGIVLTKAKINALEKVFAAEIEGRSHQSAARIYTELEAEGYVREEVRTLGGRFPVRITGWILTDAGRFAYCSTCGNMKGE